MPSVSSSPFPPNYFRRKSRMTRATRFAFPAAGLVLTLSLTAILNAQTAPGPSRYAPQNPQATQPAQLTQQPARTSVYGPAVGPTAAQPAQAQPGTAQPQQRQAYPAQGPAQGAQQQAPAGQQPGGV